jgi:hypothetical protein
LRSTFSPFFLPKLSPNKWCCEKLDCRATDGTTATGTDEPKLNDESLDGNCDFSPSESVTTTTTQANAAVTSSASHPKTRDAELEKQINEASEAPESSRTSSAEQSQASLPTHSAVVTSPSSTATIIASTSQASTTEFAFAHLPTAPDTLASDASTTSKHSADEHSPTQESYDYHDRSAFENKMPQISHKVPPHSSELEASWSETLLPPQNAHSRPLSHESDLNAAELRHNKSEVSNDVEQSHSKFV